MITPITPGLRATAMLLTLLICGIDIVALAVLIVYAPTNTDALIVVLAILGCLAFLYGTFAD